MTYTFVITKVKEIWTEEWSTGTKWAASVEAKGPGGEISTVQFFDSKEEAENCEGTTFDR